MGKSVTRRAALDQPREKLHSPKITRELFAKMRSASQIDPGIVEAAIRARNLQNEVDKKGVKLYAPLITAELFAAMHSTVDVDRGVVEAAKRARGRPSIAEPKKVVSMRFSPRGAAAWSVVSALLKAKMIEALEIAIIAVLSGPKYPDTACS